MTETPILLPVEFRGFTTFSTAYTTDDSGTVFFSLIGRVTAVKAVWAAFQSEYRLLDGIIRKAPVDDDSKYITIKKRLPDSGWAHWLTVHSQATERNLPGQNFYILADGQGPPFDAFWSRWNRALPLPARKEWTENIWQRGEQHALITQVRAQGLTCWKVLADIEKWTDIITQITKGEYP